MKKLACIAGLALLATGAFAQGTIIFNNDAATLVTTNNGGVGPALSAYNPRVTLWYSTAVSAPALPSSNNGWSFAGWTQSTPVTADSVGITGAGRFLGSTQTADTAAGGTTPWVFVAGWTGGFADFASALASGTALFGVTSQAWAQPTGNPALLVPPAAMVLGPAGFNGLVLNPGVIVPEPSSLALAGLGALGLLVFRRRK